MKVLKPIGHITVQLMKTQRGIEYIEINPRFGVGHLSIQSGADSCENLYRLMMGEKLEYNENYRENIMFCDLIKVFVWMKTWRSSNGKSSNIRLRRHLNS